MKINKKNIINFIILIIVCFPAIIMGQSTYYVSTSGNDSNSGTSVEQPWKTLKKISSISFKPGDKILFKKGDTFTDDQLLINSYGSVDQKIEFGSYGEGAKPVIGSTSFSKTPIVIISGEYIIFQDLFIQAGNSKPKSGGIIVDATNCNVKNNTVVGGPTSHENLSGISISKGSSYINIENNTVRGFGNGIVGYECLYTNISNNKVSDIWRTNGSYQNGGWGIRLIGNNFPYGYDFKYTSKISNNEIFNFERYAIDCALASNMIIEHNVIHSPLPPSYGGTNGFGSGIKAGEKNAETGEGTVGTIVRYNTIYNLKGSPTDAWQSNNGIETVNSEDGWIYGNLIYDIDGIGISRTGLKDFPYVDNLSWKIFHNTIISNNYCVYIEVRTTSSTYISNNIFYPNNNNYPAIIAKRDIFEGNNIYANRSGISSGEDESNSLAVYQRYGITSFVGQPSQYNVDPLFKSFSQKDFSITDKSPAIDNGSETPIVGDGTKIRGKDIIGNEVNGKPDIGAFEFSDTPIFTESDSELKVLLEGPFNGSEMQTLLQVYNSLPDNQPYTDLPWNLSENTNNTIENTSLVDWIIIELRSSETKAEYAKVGILNSEGLVLNSDGTKFSFSTIIDGEYFIVIKHRNHLDIMSSNKVSIKNNLALNYDFTDSQTKAYGKNAMASLDNGKFGLYAGDGDKNNIVNNLDFGAIANSIPRQGYYISDLDLNNVVNVLDYNKVNKNILKSSQVPN